MYTEEDKKTAKAFMKEIRSRTFCKVCGRQPVEFHHPDPTNPTNMWVARMTALGFPIPRIEAELLVCEPLCRSCHMKEDGRLTSLLLNRPFKKGSTLPPKACNTCETLSNPSWKGLCRKCYDHKRRKSDHCADRAEGRGGEY